MNEKYIVENIILYNNLKGLGHDLRSKILFLFFKYKMVKWCFLND